MTHGLRAGRSEAAGPDDTGLAALGDQALLGLARAGNTAAFAELYDRHRAAARRRAVRGLPPPPAPVPTAAVRPRRPPSPARRRHRDPASRPDRAPARSRRAGPTHRPPRHRPPT